MKCPACKTVVPADARFCPACGTPTAAPGAPAAELREVACLAVDVQGQAKLLGNLPVATVSEFIARCTAAMAKACEDRGGTIIRRHSAGLTAVFGAPVASERETELAVRAAFAVREAIAEVSVRVQEAAGQRLIARCGVDFGTVRVGALGGAGQYVALGAPVENAIALRNHAAPDTVLLSADAAGQVKTTVRMKPMALGGFDAAGRPETAFQAEGLADSFDVTTGPRGLFVGRGEALARLRHTLTELKGGRGAVVGVAGEPGSGKTRLVAEALAGQTGIRVFTGRCLPATASVAYAFFRAPLQTVLGAADAGAALEKARGIITGKKPELVEAAGILRDIFDPTTPDSSFTGQIIGEARLEKLVALVGVLAEHIAAEGRPVFVFEDLQWAGQPDVALLYGFASFAARIPAAIILTSRDGDVLTRITRDIITLAPLAPHEVSALIRGLAPPAQWDDAEMARVVEWARGNPLYCEEIVSGLGSGESGAVQLPASVKAAARARADRLTAETLDLAKIAACAGPEVDVELLRATAPQKSDDQFGAALEELAAAGIAAVEEGKLVFKREVVREVLCDSLVKNEREAILRTVAGAARDQGADPGVVAYYLLAADQPREAVEFLKAAGERAEAAFGVAEAISYYQRAYDNLGEETPAGDPSRFALVDKFAGALVDNGETARALELLEREYRYAETREARARLSFHLGRAYAGGRDYRKALLYYEDAQKIFQALQELSAEAETWRYIGILYTYLNDPAARRQALERALALFTRAGDEIGIASVYNNIGADYVRAHDPQRSLEYFRQALRAWGARGYLRGQAMALANLCVVSGELGKIKEAASYAERALAIARRIGTLEHIAINISNLAAIYSFLDPARALRYSAEAIAAAKEAGSLDVMAGSYINLGEFERFRGRWDEARRCAARARELCERVGSDDRLFYAYLLSVAVEVDAGNADSPEFHAYFEKWDRINPTYKETAALARAYVGAALALAGRDRDQAAKVASELRERLTSAKKMDEVCEGRLALGELSLFLGNAAGAALEFEKVLVQAEGEDLVHWPRAAFGMARVCESFGQREEAAAYLDAAEDIFKHFGSICWTGKVARFRTAAGL